MRAIFNRSTSVVLALCMAAACSSQRSCKSDGATQDGGQASVSASGTQGIGVPECDDFLEKDQRCIDDKVPDDRKKAFLDALERTRSSWKALAANPGARPGLGQACQLATQTAQTTMHQYACAW